ncbi:MAG: ABC transporter permease subunit [Acidobacteria bacterium]|nr:ABC transporter permease subunit [Acidobacteriota bacterium]MCW5968048.1 ABC transporter permease subunit [Blastocatellales bacterium]
MRGILAIYRREMGSYFASPIAYIVIGFFLLVTGYFFYNILSIFVMRQDMMAMQAARMGSPPEMDVPSLVLRNFMGVVSTIILFMIPMLTMGVYAEERKRGTMEMLMTSPLTEWQIVLGKFFAAFSLYGVMLAPTLIFQVVMARYSDPGMPWRVLGSGYLGVLLLGAVLVAIGSFISSLTESQIIAAVVTFVVFLLLWVLDIGASGGSQTGGLLQYLSILRHFDDFSRGVIDTSSVVFYLSLTVLGLFLTLRTLDSMRWRRA